MEYSKMVSDLVKPGADILATLTPEKCHIIHMLLGVMGELGEMYKACRDFANSGEPINDDGSIPEPWRATIREELGDTEFYLDGLAQTFHVTSDDIISDITDIDPQGDVLDLAVTSAELLDRLKKVIIYNQGFAGNAVYIALMRDVHQALAVAYDQTGITRQEALDANMNKLLKSDNARYKDGKYSDRQAQERADKGADDDAPGTVKED